MKCWEGGNQYAAGRLQNHLAGSATPDRTGMAANGITLSYGTDPTSPTGRPHAWTLPALIASSTCRAQVGIGVPGPKMPATPAWWRKS